MEYGRKFTKVYLNTKIFARFTIIYSVPGLLHSTGILDLLLILFAIHVQQFDLFAIFGNLEVIQVQQLFFSEEDDRLFQDLELWLVGLDGKFVAVSLTDGPVQEPTQVVELLLDALLLHAALAAKVHDKLIDASLVEGVKGAAEVERSQVMGKGCPALEPDSAVFHLPQSHFSSHRAPSRSKSENSRRNWASSCLSVTPDACP